MKKAAPADLQQWSEELARDPASLVFLPLARAYRRQNRAEAALRLCLRGLEHHPDNTEAHGLLAMLYLDRNDHARAADEWAFVLRLDPSNFEALRGFGFCLLENGDLVRARDHLERAAIIRPDDAAVRDALRLVLERESAAGEATAPAAADGLPAVALDRAQPTPDEPWMQTPDPQTYAESVEIPYSAPEPEPWAPAAAPPSAAVPPSGTVRTTQAGRMAASVQQDAVPLPPTVTPATRGRPPAAADLADPNRLFDAIVGGPVIGALLLDLRGMVLAGALDDATGTEALAAVIGGATDEAARTAAMLGLGEWRSLMMETPRALLHVARVEGGAIVLLVARAGAPAGWMMRSAAQAASLAEQFLEACA